VCLHGASLTAESVLAEESAATSADVLKTLGVGISTRRTARCTRLSDVRTWHYRWHTAHSPYR